MRNIYWWIVEALSVVGFVLCVGCGDGDGGGLRQMQVRGSNGVWSKPQLVPEAEILDIRRQAVSYPAEQHDNAWAWDCGFGNNWYYETPGSLEVMLRSGYNLTGSCVNVFCSQTESACIVNFPDLTWPNVPGTLNDSVRSSHGRSSYWTSLGVTFTTGINGDHDQENPHAPSRYVLPAANGNHPWFSGAERKECVPWVWNASSMILLKGATPAAGDKSGPPPGSGPC